MTEEEHRERSCTSKVRHATELVASGEATRILAQEGIVMQPYQCRYCHAWHLATDHSEPARSPTRSPTRYMDPEITHNEQQRRLRLNKRKRRMKR